jgi:hypothetical protein
MNPTVGDKVIIYRDDINRKSEGIIKEIQHYSWSPPIVGELLGATKVLDRVHG